MIKRHPNMGSRDIEKMQKAKRRLAAVTFLTNISLDGSYKDTGWCQEQQRITRGHSYSSYHHHHHHHHHHLHHSQHHDTSINSAASLIIPSPLLGEKFGAGLNGYDTTDYRSNHKNGGGSGGGAPRNGLTLCNGNKGHSKRDSTESGVESIYDSKQSLSGCGQESSLTTSAKDALDPTIASSALLSIMGYGSGNAEKENAAPGTADALIGGRKRANTNELGNFPKGMKRTDLVVVPGDTLQQEIVSYGQTPKHAHFSSAESIENGIQMRFQKATPPVIPEQSGDVLGFMAGPVSPPPPHHSTSSQSSTTSAKGEVKFFNLRENPNSLPTIKNERLVIMVGKRSPCVVFSSIPYVKSSRFARVQDRVQEGLKRTRNTSGSRPLSSLSEPDPLEQLLHDGDTEISYGHLLKPSNHPPCDPTYMAQLTKSLAADGVPHLLYPPGSESANVQGTVSVAPVSANTKVLHPFVSRCMSYDGVLKSSSGGTISSSSDVGEKAPPVGVPATEGSTASGGSSEDDPPPTLNNPAGLVYNPTLLDDPELRAGRNRTLMTFPSYMTSVIDYCKAADLKKELNDKFRERFPHIQLTLSKMRSLKREMRRAAKSNQDLNVDLLTVAQSYVYFEKLILGNFVTKFNRKYCAGACLLLSAKLNDIKGDGLHVLIEKIETTFRVNRKDLLAFEFAVLVALEFSLHIPSWEVAPHYQRLVNEA